MMAATTSRVLGLDPIGGVAGDMFLALCVDLGVDAGALEAELRAALPVPGWRFALSRQSRHAIEGTHLEVVLDAPELHPHRSWRDIRALIAGASALPAAARERALATFERLAAAEAAVHGVPVDEVGFHEVGAVDSIVDVVGAALAVERLGAPALYCNPPPMGSGIAKAAHGAIPLPAPATLRVLTGRAVRFEAGRGERTTPTGAALVAALTRPGPFPDLVLERVGYGVGTRDFPDRPNLLRGVLGTPVHGEQACFALEVNLDDASPQLIAYTLEQLLAAGALDVWVCPVTMKKGRPGHLLGALAPGHLRAGLTELLLRETTSLGVRAWPVERTAAERSFETVETPWGPVRIKRASLPQGAATNVAPEYEDCARLARERGVPLKEVLAAALAAARAKGGR